MANTSGLANFNLDLTELIEEAFERAGLQLRTGYDMRTARRSLNLLTIEWANRGINLWTIEQGQITINTGQAMYAIPVDTIDLLDQVIRTGSDQNQVDINISRISESTYSTIPTKNAQGRPIQVWINRQTGQQNTITATLSAAITSTATTLTLTSVAELATTGFIQIGSEIISYQNVDTAAKQLLNCFRGQNGTTAASHTTTEAITVLNLPNVNVWPTGDGGGPYTFVYWRLRRLQNAGDGVNVQDIPFRFITCLVAGLAFMIAAKKPEVSPDRVAFLKVEYEQQWLLASQEDRDKAADRYVPRQMFY
jgi:hypothetical protein